MARSVVVVPSSLCGGEARLYDAWKAGLPELVATPSEKQLAERQWWLVHFPSRTCRVVEGDRLEGMRLLKKITKGVDEMGWLPKKVPTRARASGREAGEKKDKDAETVKPPANQIGFTPVPEGADFDQAMLHVFPVPRLTQHFERLLTASEPIYDKEGHEAGEKPAFTTQFQTLKALVEWHQGRPREREKKKDAKPVLGISELRQKLLISPEYRSAMLEMIRDCEAEAARAAGGGVQPIVIKS